MSGIQQLLSALPTVATSWPALIGYVVVVIALTIVSLKVTRNKNLLDKLKSVPAADRARVLHMEMGEAYLATGLSPEQWLQQQRQRYYFLAFVIATVLTVSLGIAAFVYGVGSKSPGLTEHQAEERAKESASKFVEKVSARDFANTYDMLPDELKRNVSFAQSQADLLRTVFQLPPKPLRHSVEQVVNNGGSLFVIVVSEFSVETKIRNVVMFSRIASDWRLWNYNWQPYEWPLVWPAATVIRTTAADAMKVYEGLTHAEQQTPLPDSFRGSITGSSPGWRLVVDSSQNEHDSVRCSLKARESDSSVVVELKHVIGGCNVKPGQRILVNGVISEIDQAHIDLDAVRYYLDV